MSLMNNRKSLAAATLTGVLVFVIFVFITMNSTPQKSGQNSEYQFVVAKKLIKKDSLIKEDDIKIKGFGINIDGTFKATGEVIGRKANKDIEPEKPVLKGFLYEIKAAKEEKTTPEPSVGFRAIPILIRKSALPPYISTGARFDLFTKENSMRIENLKILSILEPEDKSTKMLILEIKNSDVPSFIQHQLKTRGIVFVRKNKKDYGEYRFFSDDRDNSLNDGSRLSKKVPTSGNLPPIDKIPSIDEIGQIGDLPKTNSHLDGKEVELVVGNVKTKVKFDK